MTNTPEDNSMYAPNPRPEFGSRIGFRAWPQAFPNLAGFSRSAVALFRLGTHRARLAAALMVVSGGLLYQTGAQALEQSSREILYLDVPSVSLQRAEKAGGVARSYTAPDSSVDANVLAWVGVDAPSEDTRRALASITTRSERPAGGVSYDDAVDASDTMVAQLGGDSSAGGGTGSGELALVDPVRPKLGDGTKAPDASEQGTVSDQQPSPMDTGGSGDDASQNPAPSELGLPEPMAEDYAPSETVPTDYPGDEELAAVPGGDHEGATGPISDAYTPDAGTTDEKGSDGAKQDGTAQAPPAQPTLDESGRSGDSGEDDGASPIIVPVPDTSDEQAKPDEQPEDYAEVPKSSPSNIESSTTGGAELPVEPSPTVADDGSGLAEDDAPEGGGQDGEPQDTEVPEIVAITPPGEEEPTVQGVGTEAGSDARDGQGQGAGNGNQPEGLIDSSDTESGTQHLSVVVHQESDTTDNSGSTQEPADPQEAPEEQKAPGQFPNTASGAPDQDHISKPESNPEAGSEQTPTTTAEQTFGPAAEPTQRPKPDRTIDASRPETASRGDTTGESPQHQGVSSDRDPRALDGGPNQGPITPTPNGENESQRRQGGTGIQNQPGSDQDQPPTQQPPAAPNQTTDGGAPRNTADGTTERGVDKQPATTSLRERKPSATSRKPRQSPVLQGGGKAVGDQADGAEGSTRSSKAVQVSTGNVAASEPSANAYDQPPATDTYTEPATDTTSTYEAPQSEPVYQEQVTQVASQELQPAPQVATQRQKSAPQVATQALEPATQVPSPAAPKPSGAPSRQAPQTASPAPQPAAAVDTTIRNVVETGGQK